MGLTVCYDISAGKKQAYAPRGRKDTVMAENKKTKLPVSHRIGEVSPEDRRKALDTALKYIEKEYGKGAIMRLGQGYAVNVTPVSTGSFTLDAALGIGGLPKGRITEIYGPEGSGKTTLALHAAASVQKSGGTVLYIDVEHAFDVYYAIAVGVDIDSLLISQPDTGEQALDIAETFVRSGSVSLVVIDSVAALIPRMEMEGEMGDSTVGALARLMSQSLRRLVGAISKNDCTMIFINQMRMKIGGYGNPETTPGGMALKYYSTVRLKVTSGETLTAGKERIGSRIQVKVVKNKVAPPFRTAEFDIVFGQGINRLGEIADLGVRLGIIEKASAWYDVFGSKMQGRDEVIRWLGEDSALREKLEGMIRELLPAAGGIPPEYHDGMEA